MKLLYSGPHAEIEVAATGQRCERGDVIDVPEDLGKALLEQAPDDWSKSKAKPKGNK